MDNIANYEEHARAALEKFDQRPESERDLLVNAVRDMELARVLDLGCGAGQELLPFLEQTNAHCFGVDRADGLGLVTRPIFRDRPRASFTQSKGEELPFADASFDVVLCRVALPYMNNCAAIAEIARILRPGGVLLLKTHAPGFYWQMIRERSRTLNPKQVAYPVICLAASVWHSVTGSQLENGFWRGKEVFQTTSFLVREFDKNGLEIAGSLADDNPNTPSLIVRKRMSA